MTQTVLKCPNCDHTIAILTMGLAAPSPNTVAPAASVDTWLEYTGESWGGHRWGSTSLYADYLEWTRKRNERPVSHKKFSLSLQALGLSRVRTNTGTFWERHS